MHVRTLKWTAKGLENINTEPKKQFQIWLLVCQNLNTVTTEFFKPLLQNIGKIMLAMALWLRPSFNLSNPQFLYPQKETDNTNTYFICCCKGYKELIINECKTFRSVFGRYQTLVPYYLLLGKARISENKCKIAFVFQNWNCRFLVRSARIRSFISPNIFFFLYKFNNNIQVPSSLRLCVYVCLGKQYIYKDFWLWSSIKYPFVS